MAIQLAYLQDFAGLLAKISTTYAQLWARMCETTKHDCGLIHFQWIRVSIHPVHICPYLSMSKLNASQCLPLPGNAGKLEICEGHQDLDLSRQSLQSCDLSKFSIVQPLISVPGCSLKSLCQVQISSGCDELQQWAIAFQVLVECSPCTAGSHKNTSHPNGINDCLSIRDFDSIFFCCNRQQFRKGPAKFSDTVQYHDAAWNSGNMKSSWVYMGRPRRRKRRTRRNNICSAWLMNLKLGRVKLQWKGLSRQWNPIISHSLSLSLSLSFSLFRISSLLRLRAARPQRCSTMPRQRPRNQHPWRPSKSCRTLQWNSQQQNSTNTTSGDSGDSSDSSHKFCSMQCPRQTFAELNSRRLHRADPSDVYFWPNFIKLFKTIPYHMTCKEVDQHKRCLMLARFDHPVSAKETRRNIITLASVSGTETISDSMFRLLRLPLIKAHEVSRFCHTLSLGIFELSNPSSLLTGSDGWKNH